MVMTTSTRGPGMKNAEAKTAEGASSCWHCQAAVAPAEHFCASCGKVQPPAAVDHFTFFGLPRRLNLDLGMLEKEFYRLSRKLHPDVFARASSQQQQWSLEKSSQLNDAYRALKDPIARTAYLLSLEGVQLEEQSKAATDRARQTGEEKKQVVPPELLEEVFELNMQLQELRLGGEKDPEIVSALRSAKQNFENRLQSLQEELQKYWESWDAMTMTARNLPPEDPARRKLRDQMVDLLNRRSYIRNLVRDVNEALQNE
jgi:molecular chaperone HscB